MNESALLHKRVVWMHLLPYLLAAFFCLELAACAEHRTEHRNLLSHLHYDSERPPPPADQKVPVALVSSYSPKSHWPLIAKKNGPTSHAFDIPSHPSVKKYVSYYRGQGRITFARVLERAWPYIPVMSKIFESNGVPPELIYIAFVESHFNNRCSSRGLPAGFWQMMPATARSMGLTVDRHVDERLDIVKSTDAAARHLRELYDQFASWPLALAAYNAGGELVRKAMRGNWDEDLRDLSVLKPLPNRTREYVSKVMAVILIAREFPL